MISCASLLASIHGGSLRRASSSVNFRNCRCSLPVGMDLFIATAWSLPQTLAPHPVDDAKGNAEALLAMKEQFQLKMRL